MYFGSDVFLSCFQYLLEHHQIMALYTYHNNEDYFQEFAIAKLARERSIPIHYEEITEHVINAYQRSGCEPFVIAEYNKKIRIPQQMEEFRGLNIHNSLLPQGRSYYPIESAMAIDAPTTGVTIHKLTSTLDGGAVLAQSSLAIKDDMDSIDVYLENAQLARDMLVWIMNDFTLAWQKALPQNGRQPQWKRPDPVLLTLTHEHSVDQALDMFRRFNRMMQVQIDGVWYYVTSLMKGKALMQVDVCQVQNEMYLYRLVNGHVRLSVSSIDD